MCLIAWNWQPGTDTPLLLLSNRDEFYARPTAPLQWWGKDDHTILSGCDLQAGGTWLGLSRGGRLAALTNFREAAPPRNDAPSRGELVASFLDSHLSAQHFLADLATQATRYNPFNLLVFDGVALLGLESRGPRIVTMAPGLGAVSNAAFQTPWPKLLRLQNGLQEVLAQDPHDTAALNQLLYDGTRAPDAMLPKTGVSLLLEQVLSPIFVTSPLYGTRASSVLRLHHNRAEFSEQTFNGTGPLGERYVTFDYRQPSARLC